MLIRAGIIIVGLLILIGVLGWVSHAIGERTELKNEIVRLQKLADTNAELARQAREAETVAFEKLTEVSRDADDRSKSLREALERANNALRSCRVDANTLRVLNRPSRVPGAPAAATVDRAAGAAVETGAGSTCEAVVVTFDENHARYDALRVQLQECVGFYNRTREAYCKATGSC